jgi:hypothetical protein
VSRFAAASLIALVLGLAPRSVSADAIGPCPDGETVVTNPTPAGAMHHGGFHCEPDPNASRCSALPGARAESSLALVLLGIAGVALASRRR